MSSFVEQAKLNDLRDRCECGRLSEAEHQELIRYEDQQEQVRVARLSALIELANSRNIDLLTLKREIQTNSQSATVA